MTMCGPIYWPRIAIFKTLMKVLLIAVCLSRGGDVFAQASTHVVGLKLIGLNRTDPRWLEEYIGYQFPIDLSEQDLSDLQAALTTTSAFTSVRVTIIPAPDSKVEHLLQVEVQEKWTLIPVIRGAYGGGTPLKVLGIYDIHALGRLLTFGAEMRQYGNAPPGFVLYGRDPRGDSNRHYLGGEVWREFRRRQVIDAGGDVVGALSTNMTLGRLRLLLPFNGDASERSHHWKYGGEAETVQEAPSVFDPAPASTTNLEAPPGIVLNTSKRFSLKLLPTLLYDAVTVDHIEYDGLRVKLRCGPVLASGQNYGFVEGEVDYFQRIAGAWNFAMRTVVGQSSFSSLQSEYFLGGLDTIRGLPDGAIYGTHAAFTNIELRHISLKAQRLWLQTAAFVDAGAAGPAWADARQNARSTAGVGLRLAVPQVYRLMLRIDYAWSLSGPHRQGITAGINQFFDPYTPL